MPEENHFQEKIESTAEPVGLDLDFPVACSPLSAICELSMPTLPDVPPVRASAGRASVIIAASSENDTDLDAEGESDPEDDDNDEYVPSRLPALSQRRSAFNSRTSSSARSSKTSGRKSAKSPRTSRVPASKKARSTLTTMSAPNNVYKAEGYTPIILTAPRCAQFRVDTLAGRRAEKSKLRWRCTFDKCGYIQTNHRAPDLTRHIASHGSEEMKHKFVCRGVPLAQAKAYGIPKDAKVKFFKPNCEPTVGGCGKGFCRKDSLQRHMRGSKKCIGNLRGAWHPFNH